VIDRWRNMEICNVWLLLGFESGVILSHGLDFTLLYMLCYTFPSHVSICFFDLVTMRQIVLFYFIFYIMITGQKWIQTFFCLIISQLFSSTNQTLFVFHIAPFKIHLNRNQCNDVTESGSLCTNLVYYCKPTYKYARNS
jgi:hypothetical protein